MAAITSSIGRTDGAVRVIGRKDMPLAADAVTKVGGLAVVHLSGASKGFYDEGAAGVDAVAVGRFKSAVDNTGGADGDLTAIVEFFSPRTVFLLANDSGTAVVAADREGPCFILDDQTVTGDASTNGYAGLVFDVDSSGVWVEVGANPREERTTPPIQSGTSTLAAGTKTVTGVVLGSSSRIIVTMKDPGAGAITDMAGFDVPAGSRTATQFVVNAIDGSKATIATAVCAFDYVIVG